MPKPENTDDDELKAGVDQDENLEDETEDQDDDDQGQTGDDTEEDDSEETGESEDESDDEGGQFEKRFTQFKGETPEEYAKNLEDAYDHSSKEALKLKKERDEWKAKAMAQVANPDEDKDKPVDPHKAYVDQQIQKDRVADYQAFVAKHPELEDDEDLFDKLDKETAKVMNYIYSTEKRMPTLAEGLTVAWALLNPNAGDSVSDSDIAKAAKTVGGAPKNGSRPPKVKQKPKYTDAQVEHARKTDPSLRDKSRAEVEAELAKYS